MAPFPGAQVKWNISELRAVPKVLPHIPSQLPGNHYYIFYSKVAITLKMFLHVPRSNLNLCILDLTQ